MCDYLFVFILQITREKITLTSYRRRLSDVQYSPDLLDVLWLRIFSFLVFDERMRISCVCRRWDRLCRDSTFWRFVDFKLCTTVKRKFVEDSDVEAVVSYSAAIQIVDLSGIHCQLITDLSLGHLAKYCPRLRKLNLSDRVLVTSNGIAHIASLCRHIEVLVLDNCCRIGDKGIAAIARCSRLSMLSIAHCFKVSDKSLVKVAKRCPKLQALDISGCTRITDKSIKTLGRYSKLLTKISLKNTTDISIDAIEILVKGVSGLRHVELGILQDEVRTIAALNIIVYHCRCLGFISFQHHHSQRTTGGDRKIVPKKRLGEFIRRLSIAS